MALGLTLAFRLHPAIQVVGTLGYKQEEAMALRLLSVFPEYRYASTSFGVLWIRLGCILGICGISKVFHFI